METTPRTTVKTMIAHVRQIIVLSCFAVCLLNILISRLSSLWQKSGFGIDTTDPMYYTRTYGDGYDP